MTKNIKYGLILLSICAVSAFALAMTNSITAPVIQQYEFEQRQLALTAVSNGYAIGSEKPVEADPPHVTYTIDLTDNGQLVGYIVGLKSAGYGGQMTLVASYKVSGEMMVAQLLTHSETPLDLDQKPQTHPTWKNFKELEMKPLFQQIKPCLPMLRLKR